MEEILFPDNFYYRPVYVIVPMPDCFLPRYFPLLFQSEVVAMNPDMLLKNWILTREG